MVETSVVILNYNGQKHLKECFESLEKQTYKDFEIIFVDNDSKDGSVEYVRNNFPKTKIIVNSINLGFAEGNNVGMRIAQGDYIAVLNNDTRVVEDWLKHLVKEVKRHPMIGMCASKMIYYDDPTICNSAGIEVAKNGRGKDRGIKEPSENYNKDQFVLGPCGGAAFYTKKMLEDVKEGNDYFDSNYFIYYEDLDLALRGQSRGWKCRYVSSAVVYHKEGMDAGNVPGLGLYFGIRNKVYTIVKNWPRSVLFLSMPRILFDQITSFFYYALKLNMKATTARIHMFFHLPLMIKKRQVIQIRKKEDITPLFTYNNL